MKARESYLPLEILVVMAKHLKIEGVQIKLKGQVDLLNACVLIG